MRATTGITIVLICLTLLSATKPAIAAELPPQQPREDNLLILGIKIDYLALEDVIPAYRSGERFYLPLSILGQILGLAIQVDLGTKSADGFIIKEERQFHLNAGGREVILSGERIVVPEGMVFIYPDDIYVDATQLQQWWPMDFEINLYTSQLLIKTHEKLPFQRRMARENEIAKIMNKYRPAPKNYPKQKTTYELYSPPFIDHRMTAHTASGHDDHNDDSYTYSTHVKADVLYHEASLFVSGTNENELDNHRVTMSRSSPDAGLLGFMDAHRYSFIHVNMPSSEYISSSQSGVTGIIASSFPLKRQKEYDRHTFEGELLQDWEVELYHNNSLIAYRDKPVNGQYKFEDVALLFGHNYFKLIFYGPHGESREETHTFSLTGALVKPGTYYYNVGIAEENDSNESRSYIMQDIGINKYVSSQVNLFSIPLTDNLTGLTEQHNYADLALNGFWSSLFFRLNYINDLDGGNLNEISVQNRVGRTNINASLTKFNDFTSERYQLTNQISTRKKIRIDTAIPPWILPPIPITLSMTEDEFENGNTRTEYHNRISTATRGLAVTNSLTRTKSSLSETIDTGQLQISTHQYSFSLRSEFYYQIKPARDLTSIGLNFSGKYFRPYQFNIGVTKLDSDEYHYILGMSKQFGNYAFQANTTYKTTGETDLDLSFSISLGRDPRSSYWHTQAQPLASNGGLSILVYQDLNQNGIQDPGEKGLEKIGFRFNDSVKTNRTNKNGIAMITGFPAHTPVDVSIDLATLIDPLMVPATPGVRLTPRAGHIEKINIPVILTGEIDGVIYIQRQGKEFPVGDIEIELYDENGKLFKTTRSAYDGFYVLSKIPAGRYTLITSSKQATELGLLETLPREIVVNPEDPFISNLNFVVFNDPEANKEKAD